MDYEAKDLLEFFKSAGRLKKIKRTGWLNSGIKEPESVADHSYRTTLMAIVLSDIFGLDTLKVARIASIHDIAEGRIGDLTPTQKRKAGKTYTQAEDREVNRLLSMLPETMGRQYAIDWNELTTESSAEARLVKDVDKLEMILQAKEYESETDYKEKLMRFMHAEIRGEKIKELVECLKKVSQNYRVV